MIGLAQITLLRVDDGTQGPKGEQGSTGAAGQDAFTILLTNETHSFSGGTSAAIAGSAVCGIMAYKGGTKANATIGSISGMPAGMTVSVQNNGTASAQFTVAVTTAMVTRAGVLAVPITVDGKSFTKNFTYTLALTGATGSTGAAGQGVENITPEYAINQSKTTAPTSGWSTTSPAWTSGSYIWTRSKIVYKNPASTVYTTPVRDIGADAAGEIQVGGRNLLENSSFQQDTKKWSASGTHSAAVFEGRRCMKCSGKLGSTRYVAQSLLGKLEAGETYTVSGWVQTRNIVKGNTNFALMFYHDGYYDNNGTSTWYNLGAVLNFPVHTTKWTFVSNQIVIPEKYASATTANTYIYLRDFTGDVYYYNYKIEKGNKATDWTPAPEDVQQSVVDMESTMDANTASIYESIRQSTYYYENVDSSGNPIPPPGGVFPTVQEALTEEKKTVDGISQKVSRVLTKTEIVNGKPITKEIESIASEIKQSKESVLYEFTNYVKKDGNAENLSSYVKFGGSASGDVISDPQIKLGRAASPITLNMVNDQIAMVGAERKISWWEESGFNCEVGNFTSANVTSSIRLGNSFILQIDDAGVKCVYTG